jgi:hypothetical protein
MSSNEPEAGRWALGFGVCTVLTYVFVVGARNGVGPRPL